MPHSELGITTVENTECINKNIPGRSAKESQKEYYDNNKESKKEYTKAHYIANKEKIKQQKKSKV